MEKATPAAGSPCGLWARYLIKVAAGLSDAARPAWIATGVLIVIWCAGRVMEALNGNPVFDMPLTYWFSLVVGILLILWVAGAGLKSLEDLRKAPNIKTAGISWIFFLALAVVVFINLSGFRVAAEGLFAALAGSQERAQLATFLLIKFHPLNPMLTLNLAALKLTGAALNIPSLSPYVWGWNGLFAFFIWSCAYGIVLLLKKDNLGPKSVHLCLAVLGLATLIILKSLSTPTSAQMLVFQASASIVLVFQVLLAYAFCRTSAAAGENEPPAPETNSFYPPAKNKAAPTPQIGLPPSAIKLALALFLVLPIMTDLQSRFSLASASSRIIKAIKVEQVGARPEFVTVAPISIRSGPTAGDDILGVLPKGARIAVRNRKAKWVDIGSNRWVPEKFLRPLNRKEIAALGSKGKG